MGNIMLACLKDSAHAQTHTHTHTIYMLKSSVYGKYIYVEQNMLQYFCKMFILEENVIKSL